MAGNFSFKLQAVRGRARAGLIQTPHGQVLTPIFMPVGTVASVKSLDSEDLVGTKAQIILANTYHLYLRPGTKILEEMGGVHQFMRWFKPMLTDSGGYQVFSLGKKQQNRGGRSLVKITDDGVEFKSHLDGSKHQFTPEKSIEIQRLIGADIIMSFDECSPDEAPIGYLKTSLERTHAWAERGLAYHQGHSSLSHYRQEQALFGIVQGGSVKELRLRSAQFLTSLPFAGFAVGGETIGFAMQKTVEIMSWIETLLPEEKPRYAMGLGRDPQDIIDAVLAGFDMFDCVGPTRLARNGSLYTGRVELVSTLPVFVSEFSLGRLAIGNARFANDPTAVSASCNCYTCRSGYSRSYLHHLYKAKELSYYRLASIHNLYFMLNLVQGLRNWILGNKND